MALYLQFDGRGLVSNAVGRSIASGGRFIATGASADSLIIRARLGDVAVWDPAPNASNSHPIHDWPTFGCSAAVDRESNWTRSWKRTHAWLRTSFPSPMRGRVRRPAWRPRT
jgi:hypothetical protein